MKYREQVEKKKVRRSKTSRSKNGWRIESGKNIKQNKSKESGEVFSAMKEIYSRVWHLRKKERFRKYKGGSNWV